MSEPVHGTPAGFEAGCRGGCPNKDSEDLMTCREAVVRYRGDWRYRRAVDAGNATAEKEEFALDPKKGRPKAQIEQPTRLSAELPAPAPEPVPAVVVRTPAPRIPKPRGTAAPALSFREAHADTLAVELHCRCGADFLISFALEARLAAEPGVFCPRGHALTLVEARASRTTRRTA